MNKVSCSLLAGAKAETERDAAKTTVKLVNLRGITRKLAQV
jgi:hypothetical protein